MNKKHNNADVINVTADEIHEAVVLVDADGCMFSFRYKNRLPQFIVKRYLAMMDCTPDVFYQ